MHDSAADKGTHLFPPWLPILIAAGIGLALYLLFPGSELERSLERSAADRTSIAYLRAMAEHRPQDREVRLSLVRQYLRLGETGPALQALEPLLGTDPQVDLLQADILRRRFFALARDDPRRAAIRKRLHAVILSLKDRPLTIAELERLAGWSLELGWPRTAAEIYDRLVERAAKTPATPTSGRLPFPLGWLPAAHAAPPERPAPAAETYALKALDALEAADATAQALTWAQRYIQRFPHSAPLLRRGIALARARGDALRARDWGRRYVVRFDAGEQALTRQIGRELAADRPAESLQWVAQALGKTPDNPALLRFGISLALATGATARARQWGQSLLALRPDDQAAWRRQIDLELADSDLSAALATAQELLERHPDDPVLRQRAARIAEWAGRPRLALRHWLWLAQHQAGTSDNEHVLTLARQLFDYRTAARLLALRAGRRALTDAELEALVAAFEALGEPAQASARLSDYLRSHPRQRNAWQRLAELQRRYGDLRGALATRETMAQRFATGSRDTSERAMLLVRLDRPDQALELLRNASARPGPRIAPDDREFWRLYGDLAWELGADDDAGRAYRNLFESGHADRVAAERYLVLVRETLTPEAYGALAERAWRRHTRPMFLLGAMENAYQAQRWETLARLLKMAEARGGLFASRAQYWVLRAALASHRGRYDDALADYERALAADPGRGDIRAAMLWLAIDLDDPRRLRTLLRRWQGVARHEPELWQAYAAAWRSLGEPTRALPWYRRAAKRHPRDYLLLLGYADTLQQAGYRRAAWTLRRHIFTQLRPRLMARMLDGSQGNRQRADLLRRYAELLRDQLGAAEGEQWLRTLVEYDGDDPLLQEFAIGWFLSRERIPPARHWLLRAHARRLELPAWQQLALALQDNDPVRIERILAQPDDLLPADRAVALRRAGYRQLALTLAASQLDSALPEAGQGIMRRQASDLAILQPNGFETDLLSRNIGDLDLVQGRMGAAFSRGPYSLTAQVRRNRLSADRTQLDLGGADRETDLGLHLSRRWLRGESGLEVGVNLRSDANVPRLIASHLYPLRQGWNLGAQLALGELSEESGNFRALGYRNRFSLSLSADLTEREYLSAAAHRRRYRDRDGDRLADGWGLEWQLGHRILPRHPEWRLALYGTWSRNDLAERLPAALVPALPPGSGVGSLLPEEYREIGLTTALRKGEPDPWGHTGAPFHYLVEASAYYSDTSDAVGYLFSVAFGTRVFGRDDLSLHAYYSDAQGGVDTRANRGLGLRYSYRFD